jgi:hypothetical protein
MRFTQASQSLLVNVAGMSFLGVGITGTFAGTLAFYRSMDGVNFTPMLVHSYPWVESDTANTISTYTKTPSGSVTQTLCCPVAGFLWIKVVATSLTSGNPLVALSSADDASYPDAFSTIPSIFVAQSQTHAANTITVAANANHGWRLATLSVGIQGSPTTPSVAIKDSAGTVLWSWDLAAVSGPVDLTNIVRGSNIQSTPNNALIISVPDLGSGVTCDLNIEARAA